MPQSESWIDIWLRDNELHDYREQITSAGYTNQQYLLDADLDDIEETLGRMEMQKPARKTFLKAWHQLKNSASEKTRTKSQVSHGLGSRDPGGSESYEFDFVFSNKTISDKLCLAVREQLVARGLKVWQQKTNIPKDSDNASALIYVNLWCKV